MKRCPRPQRALVTCALALLTVTATAAGAPPTVEVFTDTAHPISRRDAVAAARLTVYRLDGLIRLQRRLSEGLPADERHAARIAGARFEAQHETLAPRAQEAAEGLVRARRHYGLDRYPAVVFDGRAVVYGVTDLATARRLYEAARQANR